MTILLLCREQDLAKEPGGYARAFRRSGARVVCIEPGFPLNGDVSELLQSCLERPALPPPGPPAARTLAILSHERLDEAPRALGDGGGLQTIENRGEHWQRRLSAGRQSPHI